ncbi:MAG: peptidoglycan-binding protein [Alphaproteobacteria bacterium]|nr:peptidoglycan-binding protein [Alphaproteobacteria bacterium]
MRPGNLLRPIAALLIAAAVNPAGAAVRDSANHDQTEGLTLFDTAAGERIDVEQDRQSAPPVNAPEELVKRIQKGLADQGFYLGPITGRMDRKTEDAIRAYQASAELPVDGRPTAQLAMDLETGGKVGQLLNRLEEVRGASVKAARDALLAHPETRHLLNESAQPDAQPRDNAACMAEPEPRCLLLEAAASARDIDKPELRDWALGEILVSQAKAGLAKDALATTRRIHDPRLVMVALRDIAKAQAVGNRNDEAQAAAAIIPDAQLRAEAYAAIAEVQASRGKAASGRVAQDAAPRRASHPSRDGPAPDRPPALGRSPHVQGAQIGGRHHRAQGKGRGAAPHRHGIRRPGRFGQGLGRAQKRAKRLRRRAHPDRRRHRPGPIRRHRPSSDHGRRDRGRALSRPGPGAHRHPSGRSRESGASTRISGQGARGRRQHPFPLRQGLRLFARGPGRQ